MKESIKINGKYLILIFSLLVLIFFLKELIMFLLKSFGNFKYSVYAIFWIGIVLLIVVKFIKKIEGIKITHFLIASVFFGAILNIIGLLINHSLGTNDLIERKYTGVYGITDGYDYQTDSETTVEHKTNVFKKNDRRLNRELIILENKYGESSERDFLFWQTAFANGFKPKFISDYTGKDTFSKNITLFFSIGPIFILESFINAIMNSWVLMIFPIIGIMFKKRIFYDELKPFENIFNN